MKKYLAPNSNLVRRVLTRSERTVITSLFFVSLFSFISCNQQTTLFTAISSSQTNIQFTNTLEKRPLFSILYYLYYYNGGGVATGDINNDGLPDIYFTANSKGHNKLYLNKGNFQFEDITDKAGVAGTSDWCSGVTMADVNGDGLLDIYVSSVSNRYGLKGHNELFINKGNSVFSESSKEYGLDVSCFTTQTAFFDYDNDGDLDCFILNQSHNPHSNIVDTSNRRKYDALTGDRLYRNDMNTAAKKFTDVSAQAGIFQSSLGYGLGLAIGDFNNDGWEDIYVGNDFHENDYYYLNTGNGSFVESGASHFNHYSRFSMGNDAADYNNDGQLDLVTVDMLPPDEKTLKTYGSDESPDTYTFKLINNGFQNQFSRNCLQRNNGSAESFSDVGLQAGVSATDWSWCPLFADFDNDGNKDLLITSGIVKRPVDLDYIKYASDLKNQGMDRTDKFDDRAINAMPDGASHPFLYKGDGKMFFTDVSNDWGTGKMKGYFTGAAYADLDNDGNLDIVINSINSPASILKNTAPHKNYITISCKGNDSNTSGIGSKVYVFTKGNMQYQQLMLTRGFQSSSEPRLHFGLDSMATIDSVLIVWPNQKYQVIKNVPANKQLQAEQKNAVDIFNYATFFPAPAAYFEDITTKVNCNWVHLEDPFYDFNIQYLIPHEQSTRGPKAAVADINKDGLDDIYFCGARGIPGKLMIQQANGTFTGSDSAVFAKDAFCEDVDAVFFDANNDGFPDLYVVSGGNEVPLVKRMFEDRLYINNGKGHFEKSTDAFTPEYENKSCVTVADIDNDGDLDYFSGNLCDYKTYGPPVTSYLFANDGHAHFTKLDTSRIRLNNIGMVTSATFADVNKDGWQDLIVTGEWMPLKVFINNKGSFTEKDIPASTGLWQSVYATDINGDGAMDILAGNWGHNSKLWAGKNGPVKLYIKDFDKNGSIEHIMAYTIDGKEYTFLAKDELEKALPVLKKAYLKYDEVAGKTVDYIFFDLFKDYQELKAETLGSACFINDGKGNFTRKDLPEALQQSPICSFMQIPAAAAKRQQYTTGGNFFGVIPYEGRYDAQPMAMFGSDDKNNFNDIHQTNLLSIKGEVRDLKWVHTGAYGNVLMVMRNNAAPIFLKPKTGIGN